MSLELISELPLTRKSGMLPSHLGGRAVVRIYAFALVCLFAVVSPAQAGLFGEDPKRQYDYTPASALVAHGEVQIGAFTYLPAATGKAKPNEMNNETLTETLFTRNVADLIRESVIKESRFIGLKIDAGPVLSAEIKDFKGTQNVTLTVRYSVKNAQGAVLYESEKLTLEETAAGNLSPYDVAVTRNFESLVRDPEFLKAINGTLVDSVPYLEGARPSASFQLMPAMTRQITRLVYSPSSAFVAGGAVAIGGFEYLPKDKVDADQIHNTAIGNIHLDRPVAAYFAEAILKELRLTGVVVESKERVLTGSIVDFSCDDLGSSITWSLEVNYVVKDGAGTVIYEGKKATNIVTQKIPLSLNSVLRRNFETLLLDDGFMKAIGSPLYPFNAAQTVIPLDSWNGNEWSGYGPSSALMTHGAVTVGSFSYPVATGKIKPIQIPNRALMRNIYIDKPIAEIMHDLTLNELRVSGINILEPSHVLTGEIQKYTVDDIARPNEWEISVHFTVRDKAGTTIYETIKSATPTNEAFADNFLEMKIVIQELISDPDFIKAIADPK